MADTVRVIAITGTIGALVAGSLAAPAFLGGAIADEPAKVIASAAHQLFPPPFDPKRLVKFDIVFDDTISTEVKSTELVRKIGYGRKTLVSIVTTPSGAYSSDALTSPNVRYPGIEVSPKPRYRERSHFWLSSFASPYGAGQSTSFSVGSFTYYASAFTPAAGR